MSRRTVALVRAIPRTFAAQAIRSDPTKIIDQDLAERQHRGYCDILESILGRDNVIHVPTRDSLPDSLFVEDPVVVLRPKPIAIGLTVGASSRELEAEDLWDTLIKKCSVTVHHHGKNPRETLDGGDVLFTGLSYLVGISKRTSVAGAKRFAQLVGELHPSREVNFIKVPHGLHLKSICSMFGPTAVLASPACDESFLNDLKSKLKGMEIIQVPDAEAANCLWIRAFLSSDSKRTQDSLIIRKDFPQSAKMLRARAETMNIIKDENMIYECDMSEIGKADGALTCCSVIFEV